MLTCKQASKALARQDYTSLPTWKKWLLKFHVRTCLVCGKYNGQVMLMQDSARALRAQEEELGEEKLSPDQKEKIQTEIVQSLSESSS